MRISAIIFGAAVALASTGTAAATYSEADLLTVSANPELADFATKVRDLLVAAGKACDSVSKMNAFPDSGGTVLAVAYCKSGQKYEAVLDGTTVPQITLAP